MRKDIPADKALDVLSLKRRLDGCGFKDDIIRKDQADNILIATNIS